MMNGKMDMTYHQTSQQCETALFNVTDEGRRKHIKKAECIKV